MAADDSEPGVTTIAPDTAFAALGNEIRMEALKVLGRADGPLAFSELRERVDVTDPGRFNYHLNELVGHFVERTPDGYELNRPGERVIEAVLSGAVTEAPVVERTPIDWSCQLCGAEPIEIEYREEQLGVFCTECEGVYGESDGDEEGAVPAERSRLYYSHLPPAGVFGRSPEELLTTAARWTNAASVTAALGICPRCSARLDDSAIVCEQHEHGDGLCDHCNRRFAVLYEVQCQNCIFDVAFVFANKLLANLELRSFLIDHGMNPIAPQSERFLETFHGHKEVVRSIDPLEAEYTFTADGEAIRLAIDDSLEVVDVTRGSAADLA